MLAKEFGFALIATVVCLAGVFIYGLNTANITTALSFLALATILGIMEVSLSFDNAVVNASVLKNMDAKWQRRFLTWGILIAVFGMRFIFPIVIVAVVAQLGFIEVLQLAFANPSEYARHLKEAHVPISAFGGTFLMLVFLKYVMDPEKEIHWLSFIERPLAMIGRLDAVQIFLTITTLLLLVVYTVHSEDKMTALIAGLIGTLVYIFIDALGGLFDSNDIAAKAGSAGLMSFIYLEVLDASFSLDGVIGAFAITKEIVVIAAGLGIGAVFVRSLTLLLVKKDTLQEFVFLEHGAHYGIFALALIMLISMNHSVHIPELVTGLIGVGFIVLSVWASIVARNSQAKS